MGAAAVESTGMGRRIGILVALVGLLAAACTGAPRPQSLHAKHESKSSVLGSETAAEDTTTTVVAVDAAGNPVAGAAARSGVTRAAGAAKAAAGPSTTPGVKGADGITPLNLWNASEDRVGLANDKITICGHAALIFASAFNTKPEDINVYWQMVNTERGGIYGRNVEATFEDDQYDSTKAEAAANACKAKNPFFILGGIGFDQIPLVRLWAEKNRQLYIHHIAVGKGAEGLQYSFTPQPTVEQVGLVSAQYITSHYKDKRIGIVHRNSENWQPGSDTGKAYMKAHGVNVVDDLGTEKNASVYSAQIAQLQSDNAQVVWFWENALAAAEFIKQAHNQGYHPTFVVFPFQTTLDVVARDALQSRIDGISTWPAYKQGGYSGPAAFPGTGYQEEIKAFEAAMAKYRPGVTPNDILWQVWIGNKSIDDTFQKCGRDCTRNRFGAILAASKGGVTPNCPVDYPRGNGRRGGWNVFMSQEAFDPGGNAAPSFRNTSWCREGF
jgi:ABC-type branched-subunit amino acid transport system substrate-binding protein